MIRTRLHSARVWLERHLPEQRLFLKSDNGTRFVRLSSITQAFILSTGALVFAWTLVASAVLLIDSIGSGSAREQARLSYIGFEGRLEAMSKERDQRAAEAAAAQDRFSIALEQVSAMQSALLASEERRRELETGIGLIQASLKSAIEARDEARQALAATNPDSSANSTIAQLGETTSTLAFLTSALNSTAAERDTLKVEAEEAKDSVDDIAFEMKLLEERHDEIFSQLEDAVTISLEPLDQVFSSVGIDPHNLIEEVRRGYSGQGGPLGAFLPAVLPGDDPDRAAADYERAQKIFEGLDRLNLYRIAAEKTPLSMPLRSAFRFTSGFGRRWGRMHEGIDLAGAFGSPVYATADGVVVKAGWHSGYGQMVEIRHPYGLTTRYGHMSGVHVTVGQNVSRGDRIGDMGNTGHSTGT
ncbi:MAG: M23 family metallopeptidase, partial [Paracoccaceae bacterium]